MNVIQEIKDLKRRFNFLRRLYEEYEEPQHEVKVFKALLTQTGTDAPTMTILENSLGEVPVFSYSSVGTYLLSTSATIFTKPKTIVFFQPKAVRDLVNDDFAIFDWNVTGTYGIQLTTYNVSLTTPSTAVADVLLDNTPLLIEVYP